MFEKTSLILIATMLLVGSAGPASAQQPAAAKPLVVQNAVLKIVEQRDIPARSSGIIEESLIREGSLVVTDQLVMKIDNAETQRELEKTEKELEMAKLDAASRVDLEYAERTIEVARAELDRALRSNQRRPGVVARSELDQLSLVVNKTIAEKQKTEFQMKMRVMNRDVSQIELELVRLRNELHQIQAPTDGVIVEVYRREGEWVEKSAPVARLVRLDKLKTEVKLSAAKALHRLENAAATFYPELDLALPQESYPGRVTFVYPEANPISSEVRVWVEIENTNLKLIPGLTGRLEIQTTQSATSITENNKPNSAASLSAGDKK
jgi:multidrug efflux pump subunit AcrA (membrane-fusion protein)